MANAYAIPRELERLQIVDCTKKSLDHLWSEVSKVKWHADILDDEGDPCGRMMLGADSSLPAHANFRWTCQLNVHFSSAKYHDGPLACGIGDTPQQAYESACATFSRCNRPELADLFRRFNHD